MAVSDVHARPVADSSGGESPRVDAVAKVMGRAQYLEDLPDLPNAAYATTLRSPLSHARIVSIDSSAAERLPGFLGVLHRDCLSTFDVHPSDSTPHQNFVATDKVRFDGDLVAMVVAADLRTARQAAQLIEVEYETLPPVFTVTEALEPGAPLVHDALGTNLALSQSLEWGDVEDGLRKAEHVFEGFFSSQNVFHNPIEPATSFVVQYSNGGFDFWVPTNHPWGIVEEGAEALGIERDRIRVRVPYVGGNFGGKDESVDLTLVAAALARKIGRPIRLVASLEESFRMTARHAIDYRARAGVDADGRLVALDVQLDIDTGAYFTGAAIASGNALNSASGAYRVPNFRVVSRTAYTNKVPAATFRNTGKTQTTFGVDCCMDSVARKLGID
ncbi:MAG TPA: molybdopterin cofactor-binding domain-containing protein, partial [Chloroflexota bacterium]|nr:molybdopterin cofactor-binding domain-containing protein [Chloroflexota bacterium]